MTIPAVQALKPCGFLPMGCAGCWRRCADGFVGFSLALQTPTSSATRWSTCWVREIERSIILLASWIDADCFFTCRQGVGVQVQCVARAHDGGGGHADRHLRGHPEEQPAAGAATQAASEEQARVDSEGGITLPWIQMRWRVVTRRAQSFETDTPVT
ncbi:unnamed protein product [Phytophthora fragariaefolia]|uniref:Unnamed protein product n=1 Tax=Phytophthora fragariaefolia TaxID=1490495 RepID=A0A9W6X664_9STRA|nr:unnamed protein product [Phytophthora fragariaefolia]